MVAFRRLAHGIKDRECKRTGRALRSRAGFETPLPCLGYGLESRLRMPSIAIPTTNAALVMSTAPVG